MKAKSVYTVEMHRPSDRTATVTMFVAVNVATRYANRTPSVEELVREYDMSRATAYRWRGAFRAARGEA